VPHRSDGRTAAERTKAVEATAPAVRVCAFWAEHDAAIAAAWSAPGVKQVDDRIEVTY
jgi:hypothetical protein